MARPVSPLGVLTSFFKHLPAALFLLAALISLLGVVRTSFLPEQQFLAGTIIDDAVYYLVPAQNLIDGYGYSFDKIHRTNGVQPAWAAVALLIVAVCPDRLSAMRLLVLTGGLLWLSAGIVLFYALRSGWPHVALLSSVLWLFTGFTDRLALQGMENGLTGFCLALTLWIGVRSLYGRTSPNRLFYWALGLLAALVCLCRVEMLILPFFLTVGTFFGFFEQPRPPKLSWRKAATIALPTVLLFGAYLATNILYFGGLLPVSAAAKQFHNQQWLGASGWPFGGFWGNLRFQFAYPWEIATSAITASGDLFVWQRLGVALGRPRLQTMLNLLCVAGLAVGVIRVVSRKGRNIARELSPSTWRRFCLALLIFAFTHQLLLALLNPYFTRYGTWYFPAQLMVFVLAVGVAAVSLTRALGSLTPRPGRADPAMLRLGLILILTSGLLLVNLRWRLGVTVADTRPSMLLTLKRAGEWMSSRLPGVQRIATISSGFVNYFAPKHHVINLDGLMNNYAYLHEYLGRGRVPDYLQAEKVEYFADYAPLDRWRHGVNWGGNIPLGRMELLRWFVVPDGSSAYAIWRLLPQGKDRDILDPCTAPCDRLSQIQFAAMVLKRYAVVDAGELTAYRRTHSDAVVVTSVSQRPGTPLRHIVMTRREFRSLRLRPAELDIASRVNATFGGTVELLGFDAAAWSVARGEEFVYTRYWRVLHPPPKTDLTIELYINPALPGWFWHRDAGAHGTFPVSDWEPGDIIAETYSLPVPKDIRPGVYPVHLGLWNPATRFQPHSGPPDPYRPGMVFVGNLEVH